MRALILEQPGRPPALSVNEVPLPVPGPGEVLVEVAACGFCYHDLLVMAGVLRRGVKPGVILGHEVAGVVAQVAEGVTTLQPGDHVVSLLTNACGRCGRCRQGREHRCRVGEGIGHGRDGGFAEYVAVSESSLVPVPATLDLTGAALFACPMGVALQATQQVAEIRPGETVVVTGASGGLGVHSLQMAVALQGRVLAVTTSEEKLGQLATLGAEEILHTDDLDFSELVLALTEDEGADVVIDTVGSALFPSTWRSLAQYGRLVLLGEVAGGPVELNLAEIIFRDARVLGSSGVSRSLVEQVAGMVAEGRLKPVVSRILPLEQAGTAFDLLSSRSVLGRLVLTSR
jgi:D-arabinose 1-dehydrogenase-like Zn-dependent alcohol dehydrogenase